MAEIFLIVLGILVVIVLVIANGFFVAAEFALVKVRPSQLHPLEKDGGVRVKAALRATKHLDGVLSATQLGITLASLALGWVGEPIVAHKIVEPLLANFGITDVATVTTVSFAVAFAIITFLHIVFGELAPKSLAIQYPMATSLNVAVPLIVFHKIFFPFIWLLNGTANFFLRRAGIHPAGEGSHAISKDEMEYVLSHSRPASDDVLIDRILIRSLRLRDTRVNEVMIPRDEINALWANATNQENLRVAQRTGHSRYPVFDGDLDKPVGILLTREWLWQIQMLGEDTPIEPLLRDAMVFPPEMELAEVLERFRQSQNHIALVVNAEGRTLGLVSFEDVLEEIVGDIRDEFDTDKKEIFNQTEDSIVVAGTLNMHELEAETGWNFEWDGNSYETVASWVRSLCPGRPPKRGETLRYEDIEVVPLETPAGSLKRILLRRVWEGTKEEI
ncbi:MAG: HlyC/CorC family transporter [Opitutales bacterium]|nr:HlyC/CorC family transporter [Opitutales bacterium]